MIEPMAWAMVALAVAALLWALWALWRSSAALLGASAEELLPDEPVERWLERLDEERARLLERKRVVLRGLRDVREERAAGRMDVEEAEALEARLKRRYATVVAELDAQVEPYLAEADRLLAEAGQVDEATDAFAGRDEAQEAAKGTGPSPQPPAAGASEVERPRCAECGTENDPDACFCKKCGLRLPKTAPQPTCEAPADEGEAARGAEPDAAAASEPETEAVSGDEDAPDEGKAESVDTAGTEAYGAESAGEQPGTGSAREVLEEAGR